MFIAAFSNEGLIVRLHPPYFKPYKGQEFDSLPYTIVVITVG